MVTVRPPEKPMPNHANKMEILKLDMTAGIKIREYWVFSEMDEDILDKK